MTITVITKGRLNPLPRFRGECNRCHGTFECDQVDGEYMTNSTTHKGAFLVLCPTAGCGTHVICEKIVMRYPPSKGVMVIPPSSDD